ncbi:MAG: DUF190 domain-containing protein [Rhodomicrobium sp.]
MMDEARSYAGKEDAAMRRVETAERLRIFVGEDDKYEGRPLYEEIVVRAQQAGLLGATVFKGDLGYGARTGLHLGKLLRVSGDFPVIVEILDSEGKVNAFLDALDGLLTGGVASLETVQLYRYSRNKQTGTPRGKS